MAACICFARWFYIKANEMLLNAIHPSPWYQSDMSSFERPVSDLWKKSAAYSTAGCQ
jgi:hypothetical protein